MNLHLAEIAKAVAPGAHAVLLVDQAGWHLSARLLIPANITILALPPKCPELNPVENMTLEDHVHRTAPMGARVLISETWYKTANVLNKVALSVQANMKKDLREIYLAPSRALAEVAVDVFAEKYQAKHHKAVDCLTKDREALLAFFNFPAEHWDHLRTTNPIESVFATVRHRTVRTKGSLSSTTARLMVFKLVIAASKTWRRLKGTNRLPKIVAGVRFKDGIEVLEVPENHAA